MSASKDGTLDSGIRAMLHQRVQDGDLDEGDLIELAVRYGNMPPARFAEEMRERIALAQDYK